MKFISKSFPIIVILFILIGCGNKDDDPAANYDSQKILECHNEQSWTTEEIADNLIGKWEWKYVEYIFGIPSDNDNDLESIKIEFKGDFTGILENGNSKPQEFAWSIGTYNIYYGFSTQPTISRLSGNILFCNDIMLCGITGSGIADGVNNYFEKIK